MELLESGSLKDAWSLDTSGIEGNKRFEGLQVVTLDQHVFACRIAIAQISYWLQQPVWHLCNRPHRFIFVQPVKDRHFYIPEISSDIPKKFVLIYTSLKAGKSRKTRMSG